MSGSPDHLCFRLLLAWHFSTDIIYVCSICLCFMHFWTQWSMRNLFLLFTFSLLVLLLCCVFPCALAQDQIALILDAHSSRLVIVVQCLCYVLLVEISLTAAALPLSALPLGFAALFDFRILNLCRLFKMYNHSWWLRRRSLAELQTFVAAAAFCPSAHAVASASPGCFERRAQLCE